MGKTCGYIKRSYSNGELILYRCIKLNKNISSNEEECIGCKHHSDKESEELPEEDLNKKDQYMTRAEVFEALSSTFKIIAEQMEAFGNSIKDIDERLKKMEGKDD